MNGNLSFLGYLPIGESMERLRDAYARATKSNPSIQPVAQVVIADGPEYGKTRVLPGYYKLSDGINILLIKIMQENGLELVKLDFFGSKTTIKHRELIKKNLLELGLKEQPSELLRDLSDLTK